MKLITLVKVFLWSLLLLFIAIVGVLSALDLNKFKPEIIDAVKEQTGRSLTLDGELRFDFSLVPTIVVEKATLSNAEWASNPQMVTLDKFELEVELLPLLNNVLQVNKLILLSPKVWLETNKKGEPNWLLTESEGNVETDDNTSSDIPILFFKQVQIEDAQLVYLDGMTGKTDTLVIDDISVDSETADTPLNVLVDLAYNNIPVDVKGEFGSLNLLTSNSVYPVDFAMTVADANAWLKGQINQPMEGKGLDIDVAVKAKTLSWLKAIANSDDVPTVKDVDLTARIDPTDASLTLNMVYNEQTVSVSGKTGAIDGLIDNDAFDMDLEFIIAGLTANIDGKVDKPLDAKGLDVTLTATMDDVTGLSRLINEPLPDVANVQLNSQLSETASALSLSLIYNQQPISVVGQLGAIANLLDNTSFPVDVNVKVADATASLQGNIAKPLDAMGMDLALSLQATDLMAVAAIIEQELPPVTGVNLSAQVDEQNAYVDAAFNYQQTPITLKGQLGNYEHYVANTVFPVDVNVELADNKVSVKGSIEQPQQLKGIDLAVAATAESLDLISELTGVTLPPMKDIDLLANINEQSSELTLNLAYNEQAVNLEANLGAIEQLLADQVFPVDIALTTLNSSATLTGQLEQPLQGKGVDVNVSFNSTTLSELSALVGTTLPDTGETSFQAKLIDTESGYSISDISITMPKTDLSGSVLADLSTEIPFIQASFESQSLDLTSLESSSTNEEQATAEAENTEQKSDRVFSDEPIALEGLKAINADISLHANQITTTQTTLKDTIVKVILNDGNLTVEPLTTMVAGGQLTAKFALSNQGKLDSTLSLLGLKPDQIASLDEKLNGAETDIDLKLISSGSSVRELMAGMNGHATVSVGKGELIDSVLGALGADALTNLVGMINPFKKADKATQLQCSVVNFSITDGVATADKGIAIATKQMNIIGSGKINLKDETIDIRIKPEPKEGIGVSAGKLASLVKISGTLANPKPTTDAGGALSTGASVGAAVATGGLSLLAEGLLDRVTADSNPCDTALGKNAASTTKQEVK
jgi:uncharacterized protein involved in outer membrane biogenesis